MLWTYDKILTSFNYNHVVIPEHPKATKNGYIAEHRVVMENYLGRILEDDEVVHHCNKNIKDNRIENLELMLDSEHRRLHAKRGRLYVTLKCPNCKTIFERERRQTHLKKNGIYTACSRRCSGKFHRYIALNGRDEKIISALSENVIGEFIKMGL